MMIKKNALLFLSLFFWGSFKSKYLSKFLGWEVHATAKIGFSLFYNVNYLHVERDVIIGHFNMFKGLSKVDMLEFSRIGSFNWFTGLLNTNSHFIDEIRSSSIKLGKHSAITSRHLIDCTNQVYIGDFSIVGGFRSQILTHSIDFLESKQRSKPVEIASYAFVSTGCIILPGSRLPSFSVLAAGSVLNKSYLDEFYVYAGAPAKPIKPIDEKSKFFSRQFGYVK